MLARLRHSTIDLTVVKEVLFPWSRANAERISFAFIVSTTIWLTFGTWPIMVFWAAYSCSLVLSGVIAQRVGTTVGIGGALCVYGAMAVTSLCYMSAIAYLWMADTRTLTIVSVVGVALYMIDALGADRHDRVITAIDLSVVAVTACVLPLISHFVRDDPSEALIIGVSMLISCLYFFAVLREVRRTRRQLALSQRAEVERAREQTLGQLAGGVAHDFNNLLTVISGNLELMDVVADDKERAALADDAKSAAAQAASVTGQLLAYSRRAALTPEKVDLRQSIESVATLMRRLLPAPISLQLRIADALPLVQVDPRRLESVLLNLCINARDAMPDGGTITILADHVHGASLTAEATGAGSYVRIMVQDEGHGIPPEHLDRVCEPYFTTKGVGKGTGLGLSMTAGFAEQSGGSLDIASEPGRGTRVSLAFPVLG